MKKLFCTLLVVVTSVLAAHAGPSVNVAVIAPSVSTHIEARAILAKARLV
jgi:hypothetical protein